MHIDIYTNVLKIQLYNQLDFLLLKDSIKTQSHMQESRKFTSPTSLPNDAT